MATSWFAPELAAGSSHPVFFFNSEHQYSSRIEAPESGAPTDGYWIVGERQALGRNSDQGEAVPEFGVCRQSSRRNRIEEKPGLSRHHVILGAARVHLAARAIGVLRATPPACSSTSCWARPFLFCAMVLVAATFSPQDAAARRPPH